ncbi:B3 domain-containing protein Os12g0592300 isoform X4 [Sorghum bicolor]|uniref:B3 domain-containing protein Os12g0592300 isoform X4 n=2 Tax=Sorghum bicolor TaxID=4558 RepID=UPI000B423FB3|nr:B3 domain-containing protein Os12g0592300 isoform X4 [Sorghum bicolor]|eukprot:XP_021302017.1 B3 domain-containing protein Os12g0592300 isoform X4 [Sorghum bicolor]
MHSLHRPIQVDKQQLISFHSVLHVSNHPCDSFNLLVIRQMVEKGCERCKEWQEHYYWEHMDVSKIRFFKRMTGDFAHRTSIPEKFVKKFNGQITEGVDMKTPSGETWHVGVAKNQDELFFVSGWEDFVKAHELKENDLLLFTCRGSSSFQVVIFEGSGCEKVSSVFGNRFGPNMWRHFNDMEGKEAECYSQSDSEDTATPPHQLVQSPHNASTSKKSICKSKLRKQPESPNSNSDYDVKQQGTREEDSDSDNEYTDFKYYYSRTANRLSNDEKSKIISLASIQPDNPAFITVLQMTNVRPRNNSLTIPRQFAADHLEERSQEIILRRPNRKDKWYVRYYYTTAIRSLKSYHWSKFVRENKLREGDICVFELMKGAKRVTMSVHVIKKVENRFVLLG